MQQIPTEYQRTFANSYRVAAIIVGSFCVAVLVLMLVAQLITPGESLPGSESWMQPIYSGVIVLGLMVVVMRRILLSNTFMRPAAMRGVQAVLKNLMNVTVICCALAEIAAIGGFVLYMLTGDYQYSWRLGVVSLLLLIYTFPRRGEWERAVAASVKAGTDSSAQIAS